MSNFLTIPVNLNLPGSFAEFNDSLAQRGLTGLDHKILLLTPKTSTSTAPNLAPILLSARTIDNLLGKNSIGAHMAHAAFSVNQFQAIYTLPIADDASDVASIFKIEMTNTILTETATLNLYFSGKHIPVILPAGDDVAAITAVKAMLDADSTLPITSTELLNETGEKSVKITLSNKSAIGASFLPMLNALDGEATPAGVVATITTDTPAAGFPTPMNITGALGNEWWTEIVNPFDDISIISTIKTVLTARDGGDIQKSGMQFMAKIDSYANIITYLESFNDRFQSVLCLQKSATPTAIIASIYAAIVARSSGNDPALPLQYINLPNIYGASSKSKFTDAERNLVIATGGSTAIVALAIRYD